MASFPTIKQDVLGRLSKIYVPKTNALIPIYEAIANSFDSIIDDGVGNEIIVDILREPNELTLIDSKESCDIIGFRITDNGKGFDTNNFEWFIEIDSMHKSPIGGKGIGHLTWVKAFSEVKIESIFHENDELFIRKGRLIEDKNMFSEYSIDKIESTKTKTSITLMYLKKGYKLPAKSYSTLCDLIFCHFLPRILMNPSISVIINDNGYSTSLNKFLTDTNNQHYNCNFTIANEKFRFFLLKTLKTRNNAGKIHYCASSRVVDTDKISSLNKFIDQLGESYAGYVISDFLDKNVLDERLGFKIREEPSEMLGLVLGWKEIREKVSHAIDSILKDQLDPYKDMHINKINRFIEEHPRYRTVLSRNKDIINQIPYIARKEDMIGIFEVERQKLRIHSSNAIKQLTKDTISKENTLNKDKIASIRQAIIDNVTLSKDTLIDYVLDRKAIIGLLDSLIKVNDNNTLVKESEIHNLIFPMRKTSNEVEHDEHNLWIIDERLAFHKYLTSDKTISSAFAVSSKKEPDILCYIEESGRNNFSSATLIEFKRPNKSGHHYDPVAQIKNMVTDLQENTCTNRDGRKIIFAKDAHFFGYIITDFDDFIRKCVKSDGNLKLNPRGDGYFHYYSEMRLWLEIISYDKLIGDAEKRNQIFFQKLGLED